MRFLKIKEVCDQLNVTPWVVHAWLRKRLLKSYKLGGAVRIRQSELERFIAESAR